MCVQVLYICMCMCMCMFKLEQQWRKSKGGRGMRGERTIVWCLGAPPLQKNMHAALNGTRQSRPLRRCGTHRQQKKEWKKKRMTKKQNQTNSELMWGRRVVSQAVHAKTFVHWNMAAPPTLFVPLPLSFSLLLSLSETVWHVKRSRRVALKAGKATLLLLCCCCSCYCCCSFLLSFT